LLRRVLKVIYQPEDGSPPILSLPLKKFIYGLWEPSDAS